jgi:hypothetical protein
VSLLFIIRCDGFLCHYHISHIVDGRKIKRHEQVNRNAAKDKSSDSSKHKRKAKARNDLGGGGQSRGRSKKQTK